MSNTITKSAIEGTYKTGSLSDSFSEQDIEQVLGFAPTISCDRKVTCSWFFQVNGNPCGIWDYKGVRWSVYDPAKVVLPLFEPLARARMLKAIDELEAAMDAVAALKE